MSRRMSEESGPFVSGDVEDVCAPGVAASKASATSAKHERARMVPTLQGWLSECKSQTPNPKTQTPGTSPADGIWSLGFGMWDFPYRSLVQQRPNRAADALDQHVAVIERQSFCRNRLADTHADVDRPDDGAALPHGGAAALDGHRHDRRLRLDGHDETALLERKKIAGPAPRPLGKNQEGVARAKG